MTATTHALCSPSSMERWVNCPLSVMDSVDEPNETTQAAEEGSLAHLFAEYTLKQMFHLSDIPEINPAEATQEMLQGAAGYAEFVKSNYEAMKKKDPTCQLYIEVPVNLQLWIQDGFGTIDCCIHGEHSLMIVDYKFGRMKVKAKRNMQMMAYAAGVLSRFGLPRSSQLPEVKIAIYQPRDMNGLKHPDHAAEIDVVPTDDIYSFMNYVVGPACKAAFSRPDTVSYVPSLDGGSQCRYCPARFRCRARAETFAAMDWSQNPETLSDSTLRYYMERRLGYKKWLLDIQEYAMKKLENQEGEFAKLSLESKTGRKGLDKERLTELVSKLEHSTDPDTFRQLIHVKSRGKLMEVLPWQTMKDMDEYMETTENESVERRPEAPKLAYPHNSRKGRAKLTDTEIEACLAKIGCLSDSQITTLQNPFLDEMKRRLKEADPDSTLLKDWTVTKSSRKAISKTKKEDLLDELLEYDFPADLIAEPESMTKLKKVLGKDEFASLVEPFIVTPQTTTLAFA